MGFSSPCTAFDLRCDYLKNPVGIENPKPDLFWKIRDDRRDAKQTAYQVQVAESVDGLGAGGTWDSGTVASTTSTNVPYAGPALAAAESYVWRVRT